MKLLANIERGLRLLSGALLILASGAGAAAQPRAKKLGVTSDAFSKASQIIPLTFVCAEWKGSNLSPQLGWSKGPAGTRSYAVIVTDPDAAPGTFYHWGIYNIPARKRVLAQGITPSKPIKQTLNDFSLTGYTGPCPPPGTPHRYVFTVYALSKKSLKLSLDSYASTLLEKIKKITLSKGTLVGRFPPES